jgi:hypothetical protein
MLHAKDLKNLKSCIITSIREHISEKLLVHYIFQIYAYLRYVTGDWLDYRGSISGRGTDLSLRRHV